MTSASARRAIAGAPKAYRTPIHLKVVEGASAWFVKLFSYTNRYGYVSRLLP